MISDENRKAFAEKLKRLREAKGLTQQELADKLNVSVYTLKKWEQGLHVPKYVDNLVGLANILGVTFDEMTKELTVR